MLAKIGNGGGKAAIPFMNLSDPLAIVVVKPEPATPISYLCFEKDPLSEFESDVSEELDSIADISSRLKSVLKVMPTQIDASINTHSDGLVQKRQNEMDVPRNSIVQSLKLMTRKLALVDLKSVRDLDIIDKSLRDIKHLYKKVQHMLFNVKVLHILPMFDCVLEKKDESHFACLSSATSLVRGTAISLQSKLFYDPDKNFYGSLLFDDYFSGYSDRECSASLGEVVHYLSPKCCSEIIGYISPLSCPHYSVQNGPELVMIGNNYISHPSSSSPALVTCRDNTLTYTDLLNIVSDCSIKIADTLKMGTGNFVNNLPAELAAATLDLGNIAIVSSSSIGIFSIIAICLILVGLCVRFKKKRARDHKQENGESQEMIEKSGKKKEAAMVPQTTINVNNSNNLPNIPSHYTDQVPPLYPGLVR